MAYEHGTISRYTAKRCRCDLCRKANREYMRAWTAKNRKPVPDELRTCKNCGTFYIVAKTSRQVYCDSSCSDGKRLRLECDRCGDRYTPRNVHYSVDPQLCFSCLEAITTAGHQCPICEIPWWAPRHQHCCSEECHALLKAKHELVATHGGNHAS